MHFDADRMTNEEDKPVAVMLAAMGVGLDAADFAETYSPERFRATALSLGLSPGLAADLRTGWDFSYAGERQRCRDQIANGRPKLYSSSAHRERCSHR